MRKVLAIVGNDLRVFLADRSNLIGLLLTPTVMTVIIGLVSGGALGGQVEPPRIDVIDQDRSAASRQLVGGISDANPSLVLCTGDNSESGAECGLEAGEQLDLNTALDRLAQSETTAVVQIPAGFGQILSNAGQFDVILHTGGDVAEAQAAQQALEAALKGINGAWRASLVGEVVLAKSPASGMDDKLGERLFESALQTWRERSVWVQLTLSGDDEPQSFGSSLQQGLGHSVPGMGSMFVMMTVLGGMAALIEERRQWTLQRLGSMPVSRGALIGAKILSRLTLGLLQFAVVFLLGGVLGMDFGRDPLALALLAVTFSLSITALSFALGSRLSSPAQASGVTLLLTLTLAPLGGAWWPLEITPRFMQVLGHISPVAWAMDGFLALTYQGARLPDVALQLVVLLAISVLAFLVSIPRFQYELD